MSQTAVVIVNWNGVQDTERCLDSLRESVVPVILIVVDNASTDTDINAIRDSFPDVILLRNEKNLGYGGGANVGFRWVLNHTDVEYIFLLNNDACIQPDTISKLQSHLINHPETGCVTPQIVFAEAPDYVWYGGGEIDWKYGSAKVWNWGEKRIDFQSPQSVTFASGCALFLRRDALLHIGGFDSRYFMYEEDVELTLRLLDHGFQVEYLPDAIVMHRVQGSWRSAGDPFIPRGLPRNPHLSFFAYYQTRNRLLTMHKHAKDMNKVRFLTFFHLYLAFRILQYLLYCQFNAVKSILQGYYDYFRIRNDIDNGIALNGSTCEDTLI